MLIFLSDALLQRQQNVNHTQPFRTTTAGSIASALQEDDSQQTEGWHKAMRKKVQKSTMDSAEVKSTMDSAAVLATSLAILWFYIYTTWSTTSLSVQL